MQLYDLQKKGHLSVKTVGKSKIYTPTESGKIYVREKLDGFRSTFCHILSEMGERDSGTSYPERKE